MAHMTAAQWAVFCDWCGSTMMLGSLWSWVHSRIAPRVDRWVLRRRRRSNAIWRLITGRYGDFGNIPELREWEHERDRRRLNRLMKFRSKVAFVLAEERIERRLRKAGLYTEEHRRHRERQSQIRASAMSMLFRYGYEMSVATMGLKISGAFERFTVSLFKGRLAAALFVVGFLLWNCGKLIEFVRAR
jgi:hypothetical protein